MKIYIIGPVGSGKTTLSKKVAKLYHTKAYELDRIIWNDGEENIKRNKEEIESLFQKIIHKKSWIIEDVGRKCFIEGIQKADIVYYLNCPLSFLLYRCIRRWIRQRRGKEKCSYQPSFHMLFQMIWWCIKDWLQKKEKIKWISQYTKNLSLISYRDI